MVKYILTPNPNPPNNLRRIHPNPVRLVELGETDGIAFAVARNQAVGHVPFASAEDKATHIAELDARDVDLEAAGEPIPVRPTLPDPGPHYIVEDSDLPGGSVSVENDYFFDAWEWDGSAVAVNMTKARAIHLTEIRRVRDEELVKLDVPWMKAVEAGDTSTQATIKGQKETLRDLPATFDITTDVDTPEKLKAKWPSELPARE
jgi:hypothetical protein